MPKPMTRTTRTPKGTLWWVSRMEEYYALSPTRSGVMRDREGRLTLSSRTEYPEKGEIVTHAMTFPIDFWHRAGGPRLKPGDGPIRIRITPGWWERVK